MASNTGQQLMSECLLYRRSAQHSPEVSGLHHGHFQNRLNLLPRAGSLHWPSPNTLCQAVRGMSAEAEQRPAPESLQSREGAGCASKLQSALRLGRLGCPEHNPCALLPRMSGFRIFFHSKNCIFTKVQYTYLPVWKLPSKWVHMYAHRSHVYSCM